MIAPDIIYESIRKEIIDQKKCQFQLFTTSITVTTAILAYGQTVNSNSLIYIAPVLLNVLAINMILDKAISIQRMVGYLQLMESEGDSVKWMWEYHLNLFRERAPLSMGYESHRKHKYVRNVSLSLLILNFTLTGLYFLSPTVNMLQSMREISGAIKAIVIFINLFGIAVLIRHGKQLLSGEYTSKAIRGRWLEIIKSSAKIATKPTETATLQTQN